MAYYTGFGPYNLMQSDKMIFIPTTKHGIIPVPKVPKNIVLFVQNVSYRFGNCGH